MINKKNPKILFLGEGYPEADRFLSLLVNQLELSSRFNATIVLPDGRDLLLLENFDEIVVVGNFPKILTERHAKKLSECTHFIFDKYIFQSVPYKLKLTPSNIKRVLARIYRDITPRKIIVNNALMKSDFEDFFNAFDSPPLVKISPNPVSPLMLERRDALDKTPYSSSNRSKLLFDTIIPSGQHTFSDVDLDIIVNPPSMKFAPEKECNVLGLLNYREKNGYFLSSAGTMVYLSEALRFGLRNIPLVTSQLYRSLEFDLFPDNLGASFIHDLNSRWKPNTKFTVATAMGIPLISQPEQSILESVQSYTGEVHFFENKTQLQDIVKDLETRIVDIRERLTSQSSQIIDRIDADFVKALLD